MFIFALQNRARSDSIMFPCFFEKKKIVGFCREPKKKMYETFTHSCRFRCRVPCSIVMPIYHNWSFFSPLFIFRHRWILNVSFVFSFFLLFISFEMTHIQLISAPPAPLTGMDSRQNTTTQTTINTNRYAFWYRANGESQWQSARYSVFELGQQFFGISEGSSGLSVLRTFRLLRILKLVRFMPNLRRQLFVMLRTMDNVAIFFSLLILFIFIFR